MSHTNEMGRRATSTRYATDQKEVLSSRALKLAIRKQKKNEKRRKRKTAGAFSGRKTEESQLSTHLKVVSLSRHLERGESDVKNFPDDSGPTEFASQLQSGRNSRSIQDSTFERPIPDFLLLGDSQLDQPSQSLPTESHESRLVFPRNRRSVKDGTLSGRGSATVVASKSTSIGSNNAKEYVAVRQPPALNHQPEAYRDAPRLGSQNAHTAAGSRLQDAGNMAELDRTTQLDRDRAGLMQAKQLSRGGAGASRNPTDEPHEPFDVRVSSDNVGLSLAAQLAVDREGMRQAKQLSQAGALMRDDPADRSHDYLNAEELFLEDWDGDPLLEQHELLPPYCSLPPGEKILDFPLQGEVPRSNRLAHGSGLCDEQEALVELIMDGHNVFYTGSAGTGKSTVLGAFFRRFGAMGKRTEKVAPTGLAALNIGGQTYFRLAGWSPGSKKSSITDLENEARLHYQWKKFNEIDIIVIDEISMIDAHQFERLDRCFRAARQPAQCGCEKGDHARSCSAQRDWNDFGYGNESARSIHSPHLPFGGVQVIVTGDFSQLPPVRPFTTCFPCGSEIPSPELKTGPWTCHICELSFCLDDRWAFQSEAWDKCNFVNVRLGEIHRQVDPAFLNILETLREYGDLSADQLQLLLDHPCDTEGAVVLCPKNEQARLLNVNNLAKIRLPKLTFHCFDHCVWNKEDHPLLGDLDKDPALTGGTIPRLGDHRFYDALEIKVGMLVMHLVNCPNDSEVVNGSQGKVVGFLPYNSAAMNDNRTPDTVNNAPRSSGRHSGYRDLCVRKWVEKSPIKKWPVLEFLNGKTKVIYPTCDVKEMGNKKPYTLLSRTQLPLAPAWAITIHKSQGMSLDRVEMNLDESFEPEMCYVALSRARSLSGLKVNSNDGLSVLQRRHGWGNEAVREFTEKCFGKPKIRTAISQDGKLEQS